MTDPAAVSITVDLEHVLTHGLHRDGRYHTLTVDQGRRAVGYVEAAFGKQLAGELVLARRERDEAQRRALMLAEALRQIDAISAERDEARERYLALPKGKS